MSYLIHVQLFLLPNYDLRKLRHRPLDQQSRLSWFNKEAKELFYSQQTNNFGELVGMTLVWHISNLEGRDYFFKSGGGGGYRSEMRIYPLERLATIIIVNRTNFNSKKHLNILDKEVLSN